jgi:hypothetical protein
VYERRTAGPSGPWAALAVSEDGLDWEKPSLGLVEHEGSADNNFLVDGSLRKVVYDPDDPDPGRRYKAFYGGGDPIPAVSSDCVHWTVAEEPELESGDAGTLTYDDERNRFIAPLKRTSNDRYRGYDVAVSDDFEAWSEKWPFLGPDDEDQRRAPAVINRWLATPDRPDPLFVDPNPGQGWTPPEEYPSRRHSPWNAQVYNVGVFPYEGLYLSWFTAYHPTGVYEVGQDKHNDHNSAGFGHIQLASTRELTPGEPPEWTRLGDREPFIQPSRLGKRPLARTFDRMAVYPSNRPVLRDDELWFYYTGSKTHMGWDRRYGSYGDGSDRPAETLTAAEREDMAAGNQAVHLAVLRRDGFVSLDADGGGGHLLTEPLELAGDRLYLNVDAEGGSASVAVHDRSGEPIDGFEGSEAVTADSVAGAVNWDTGRSVADLSGRVVRLKFRLTDASLYAFWTEERSG